MDLNPVHLIKRAWNALQAMPANPQRGGRLQFIGRNNAGVHVTHEIAFMVSAVWACIDVIASALASSDWNVYAGIRGSDQGKSVIYDDSLQYILNSRFNRDMTAQAGKRALAIAAVGYGNGYAEIQYDGAGRVVALWPISPNRVQLVRSNEDGRLLYRVAQEYGGTVDLEEGDIFHLRGAGLTGVVGDDPIARAIQSVGMSVALDQFGASFFANGTQLSGALEAPGTLLDTTFNRLKEEWATKHTGSRNVFKTAVLEAGVKWVPISSDAQKAQLIEARYQQVEEICRWFRVPPHKVAHLLRATNNNIEHQGLEFSRDTLRPWVREIQEEADYKLIPARGPRKYIELDVDWASEGDYKSRAEALQILRMMGVFSTNDVLRKLGENTISAAEGGDLRIVNGASIPLPHVGENYRNTGTPTTPEPPSAPSVEQPTTATKAWVQSIYSRIARRHENRLADLRRAGKEDAALLARDDALAYSDTALDEAREVLGPLMARAKAGAQEVITGKPAAEVVAGLFQKEEA